jgi:hypothetical protein
VPYCHYFIFSPSAPQPALNVAISLCVCVCVCVVTGVKVSHLLGRCATMIHPSFYATCVDETTVPASMPAFYWFRWGLADF